MVKLSNPRLSATFSNWPLGFRNTCSCSFNVEFSKTHGARVTKTTTGKPKKFTYCKEVAIVDGDNGKTYIIGRSVYGSITIYSHDEKTPPTNEFKNHSVNMENDSELFLELDAMLKQANNR